MVQDCANFHLTLQQIFRTQITGILHPQPWMGRCSILCRFLPWNITITSNGLFFFVDYERLTMFKGNIKYIYVYTVNGGF